MSVKTCTHPSRFGTENVPSSGMSLKFCKNLLFCSVVTLLIHNSMVTHKASVYHNNISIRCDIAGSSAIFCIDDDTRREKYKN